MKTLVSALAAALLTAQFASAAQIEISKSTVRNTPATNLLNARDAWMTTVSGLAVFSAFEDFEGFTAGTHHTELDTAAGRFVAGGNTSIGAGTRDLEVSIHDEYTTPFSGRFNYTDGGSNWLDSNDITEVTLLFLDLPPIHFLSFSMTDVNDVAGSLMLQFADGGSAAVPIPPGNGNNGDGVSYFVSYRGDEALSSVKWVNNSRNDGWGVDDIYIGSAQGGDDPVVPEPSTYLLIGAGLTGLALWRRRH